jgi:hypothetical protein
VKGRELERLYRQYLLADLPDFTYKGSLLFVRPVVHFLRGFSFDTSSFDADSFHVEAFIQPLYVLADSIRYNFGMRLHGQLGQGWKLDRQDVATTMNEDLASIEKEGLYFVSRVQTPRDLARKAVLLGHSQDVYTVEAIAYSSVLAREFPEALQSLERLQGLLRAHGLDTPWLVEMLDRSELVRQRLERDPEAAIAVLEEWNEQTRANLRLPKD